MSPTAIIMAVLASVTAILKNAFDFAGKKGKPE
jgi:hypothetical protein